MDGAPPVQVKPCPIRFAGMQPGQAMLIPTPHLVADYVRSIPTGEERDVPAMRQALARLAEAPLSRQHARVDPAAARSPGSTN